MMKNILFIGGVLPKNDIDNIINNSKGNIDFAAHNFQNKILNGLDENNVKYEVLSVPFISSYPKYYKKIKINKNIDDNFNYLPFINLPYYKILSRYFSLKRAIKKYRKKNDDCNVILYSLHFPFVKNSILLKKLFPNCKITLVVPDLQEYMSNNKSIIYRILKKIEIKKTNKYLKYFDSFVFLTEYMNNRLNLHNKPYTVIEGISNYSMNSYEKTSKYKEKYLVYTGTLAARYGIMHLIDAFMKIKDNKCKLIICGHGEMVDDIVKICKKNDRIIFKGLVSPQESRNIQNNAFALINPRMNNEEYTKYSFPSKIMEYLSTGKPIICYKLDGIPKEYDDVLIYPKDDEIQSLSECIDYVMRFNANELESIYFKSMKLISNKNSKLSVEKILKILS